MFCKSLLSSANQQSGDPIEDHHNIEGSRYRGITTFLVTPHPNKNNVVINTGTENTFCNSEVSWQSGSQQIGSRIMISRGYDRNTMISRDHDVPRDPQKNKNIFFFMK